MIILAREGKFIVTEERGKLFVWERVKSGKNHMIFRHFDGVLHARYDSHHTPPECPVPVWHALQRQEADRMIVEMGIPAYVPQNANQ